MKSYMELNENWSMRKSGDTKWRPASIPGSVYSNLLEQGEMKNPYYGENQYLSLIHIYMLVMQRTILNDKRQVIEWRIKVKLLFIKQKMV